MATKKQKRLRGIEKAAREAEESRQAGLRAQQEDRELREKRAKRKHETQHEAEGLTVINCKYCSPVPAGA